MAPPSAVADVRVEAPAKINLTLAVTGRRDDGYHTLDSLVAFAAIGDTIAAGSAASLSLVIDGPFAGALSADDPDNLVLRAARALADATGRRPAAALRLTKRLPVASGIGGGSADAAATLKALSRLWQVALSDEDTHTLALSLGADVPVCLRGRGCWMSGIGEVLDDAPPLPPAWLVLVNPGGAVSTPAVFKARKGPFSRADRFDEAPADAGHLARLLATRTNDLAAPACDLVADIGTARTALAAAPDCLLARMSGSGATCFGLFSDPVAAQRTARAIAAAHPGWWTAAAELVS